MKKNKLICIFQVKSTEEIDPFTEQTKDDSPQPPPTTPTKAQNLSSQSSMVTPKAVRSSLAKSPETIGLKKGLSPSKILKVEDEIKRNLNSEDKNVTKDKIPKSPTASHSLDNLQLKSPENKTARSSISPHTFNNSELKDLEVEIAESPTSLSSPNSPPPKSPEHKTTNLPNPPRSSHGPQLKSPSKSSSHTSKKLSPKKLQLPKLAPSPTPQRTTAVSEAHAKINLPKLIERVAH
ncbi:PREDICTED: uncharacterized protein LOC108571916 [Habropoda laboriosa]|uniref:uncharacterized protein LOC108571916 n=1 Tax=Habropoda laboriosa TaxID=597456 RepID=UPI00083D650E|nr:PREDICTED: uncharacterized protein LOC108571916 [Habropoda laboriosa]